MADIEAVELLTQAKEKIMEHGSVPNTGPVDAMVIGK